MKLVKDGISREEWVPPDEALDTDPYYEEIISVPETAAEFFSLWHNKLDGLEAGYTFGDLISLLKSQSEETIEILSALCNTELSAFLEEAATPPTGNSSDIEYLRVSNWSELETYVPDPEHPDEPMELLDDEEAEEEDRVQEGLASVTGEKAPWKLVDATADDPITGKPKSRRFRLGASYGKWVGPYNIYHDFSGWGKWDEPYEGAIEKEGWDPNTKGAISTSFIKVSDLLGFELHYEPGIEFWSGPSLDNPRGSCLFKDTLTITFGDFVRTILWELGFHGSPEERDEFSDALEERSKQLKEEHDGDGNL